MVGAHDLPALNAALNATAATLLLTGFVAIKKKRVALHKACMVSAFATSSLFLVSYVTHKVLVRVHTPFPGEGAARAVYFTILVSHTILAAATLPLAIVTLRRAWRGEIERHRKIARITWPVWLYVSVTGVVIWWMLYGGAFGAPAA
jgi:putative membrane protein